MSWTDDISKEKNATGISLVTAISLAIERVNAVLPIPGRAAMIIKSLGCHPDVSLSSFRKPVLTPLNPSRLDISSIRVLASITKFCADCEDLFMFPCVTSYSLDSASSSKSKTSVESLYAVSIISFDIRIRLR